MKKILFVIAGILVGAAIVLAQTTSTPRVDKREKKQEKRIHQGEKNGTLTPHESKTLEKREARSERYETKAKSDGKVTPHERRTMNRQLNGNSRAVARKKHNLKKTD